MDRHLVAALRGSVEPSVDWPGIVKAGASFVALGVFAWLWHRDGTAAWLTALQVAALAVMFTAAVTDGAASVAA